MDKVLNALKEGKNEEEAFKLIKKDPLIKIYRMKKGLSGEEHYKYFVEIDNVKAITRNKKGLIEISFENNKEIIELNSFFDYNTITIEY